jgi:glycosyltransferase involved in cell wall biosynthesis
MSALPLVSIVTCSYNNADFILETLDSIKGQTYTNIELVIVDDCSTDSSVAIIEEWLKTYPGKYKFIKHETNLGGSVPYNVGLRAATGKYYSAVDTDDALMPEKIERQVVILEGEGEAVAAVYSNAYVMDVKSEPVDGLFIQRHRPFEVLPSGNIYNVLLQGNFLPLLSLLMRREVFDELGAYDESLVYGDYDMWLRIARKYEFIYSDYISGRYRIRPGSLSFTIRNWDETNARIFLKHADAALPLSWINKIAAHSYSTYNDATMPHIKVLAKHTTDRCMMTTYLLWAFRVAPELGLLVQQCVAAHIEKGLSPYLLNINDAEIDIFLHEIAYSVPLSVFRKIAIDAYIRDQPETLPLLDQLADKINDKYLKATFLLAKYKVNRARGTALLSVIERTNEGNGEDIVAIPFTSEEHIFEEDVMPLVSPLWLQKVASDEYGKGNEHAILRLNVIANRTSDRFLKTVYLLWKFRIESPIGQKILTNLQERMEEGLSDTINEPADADTKVFLNEIAPTIPIELMKQIVCEDYKSGTQTGSSFVEQFVSDTGDAYLISACLLWKFKIEAETGLAILAKIDEAIKHGQKFNIDLVRTSDPLVFFNELAEILPLNLLKQVACEAYFNNDRSMLPFVKAFGNRTGSRYFKAVKLLWKYQVNAFTGKIILERVDGYCNADRNKFYIDLCVYKDIYGAYKTKNATPFRSGR